MIQLPYFRDGQQVGTLYAESEDDITTIKKVFDYNILPMRDLYWQVQDIENLVTGFLTTWDFVGTDTHTSSSGIVTDMKIYLRKGKYIYAANKPKSPPTTPPPFPEHIIPFKKQSSDEPPTNAS